VHGKQGLGKACPINSSGYRKIASQADVTFLPGDAQTPHMI
jgi:hypothetical protein